jgi:Na+/proline symporter
MLAGFAVTVLWALVWKQRFYDLYEMIPGFAVGFAVTIGVSLFTRPPAGAPEEMETVLRRCR